MKHAALALYFASLALWVGGLATISFVVAPTAFQQAPKEVAGKIVGRTLRTFGYFEVACGVIALASASALRKGGGWEGQIRPALLILMLAISCVYVLWLYPEAAAAREKIGAPGIQEHFNFLHRLSVILVASNILLGASQLVVSAARLKAPDGP